MTQHSKTPTRTSTRDKHYLYYAVAAIAAIVLFGIASLLAKKGTPTGWEVTVLTSINNWSSSWSGFFNVMTFFGSIWMALIAVVGTFALKMYQLAWRLAITIIGAYGVAYIAKHFIGRARPEELLADVNVRATESGMGFPSGHATLSTVIALTILPYLPRWVAYVVVPLFIALVCLSRLYLGVHFPLDVIGGIAIGTAAVSFVRILPDQIRKWARVN